MEPAHDGGAESKESATSPGIPLPLLPPPMGSNGESQEPLIERRQSNLSASSFSSSTSSFNSLLDINEYDLQLTPKTPHTPRTEEQTVDPFPIDESPAPPALAPVSQMADKSFVGYDPSRIPSSVFSRKSQMDWSVASNESLFSIHMGNNSFSLGKSEELLFPHDQPFNNLRTGQPQPQPQPLSFQPQPESLPLPVSETKKSPSSSLSVTFEAKEETITKPPPIIVVKDEPNLTKDRVGSLNCHETSDPRLSDSTSTTHLSDASANSSNSFVFPLLTSEVSTSAAPPASGKTTLAATEVAAPPTHLEKVASSKKGEKGEKSKSGPESPGAPSGDHKEEAPASKTWLSYFSCFSFCPINFSCLGRANCMSNAHGVEPGTKNSESKN